MRKRPNPQRILDKMPKGKPLERIARDVLQRLGMWQLRFIEQILAIQKDQMDPLDPLMAAQDMATKFVPYVDAYIDAGGQTVLMELGQSNVDDWLIQSPQTLEAARTATLALCQETVDTFLSDMATTLAAIRREVAESIASGEPTGDTVNRVAAWVEDNARWRARRIAVTESARAYNAGSIAATDPLDFVAGYKWILSSDACPLCHAIARECPVIPKGGTFAENGKNPAYRKIKFPPLHPSCRCTTVTVFDDEVPDSWPKTVVPPQGSSYVVPTPDDIMAAESGGYESVAIGNAKNVGGFVVAWE